MEEGMDHMLHWQAQADSRYIQRDVMVSIGEELRARILK